jgi:hypothetical protein
MRFGKTCCGGWNERHDDAAARVNNRYENGKRRSACYPTERALFAIALGFMRSTARIVIEFGICCVNCVFCLPFT